MALVPNNESFHPQASGSLVTNHLDIFQKKMDSVLLGGDTITLDLPAGATDCPDPTCKFNSTYGQFQGLNGALCRTCRGKGSIYEHRETIYRCNRRWTNEPIEKTLNGGQSTPGGRIHTNYVRVKTRIESFDDIMSATGATIDGQKVQMYKEPRKTGWNGQIFYVITWWERASKKNNG